MVENKERVSAEAIFKEFKEHSISEFFRKNSQMLGYSGKVRSLTTIIHEYVTNSLDACEEANILPEISVKIKPIGEEKYNITVTDNGPGIPQKLIGKALATVLAGTKFHRYLQQRGQQGIGASGCTLFAQVTTGKPIHVKSGTDKAAYECDVTLDIKSNKPLITNMKDVTGFKGLQISGDFGDIKYESSDHGVYEYLRRTVLTNPHVLIKLQEPEGKDVVFPRSVEQMPKRPEQIKPHPLGIKTSDLVDMAHRSESKKISSFMIDSFSRVTSNKISELKEIAKDVDFEKEPHQMAWDDAEKIAKACRSVKWISPDLDSLSTIGDKQVDLAIKNILNPKFQSVIERKPRVFMGGVPFVVEAGIAYGGGAGKQTNEGAKGTILRFGNKVPLLFDASICAVTQAVNGVDWKRYGIKDFDQEPLSVMVNVSSVYLPYSGVGKQAIDPEAEIVDEIKLAIMDCGRSLQKHIAAEKNLAFQESRYKTIMRYVGQLATNLDEITGAGKETLEKQLKSIVEKRYKATDSETVAEVEGSNK